VTWTEPRPDLLQRHRDAVGVTIEPEEPCFDRAAPIEATVARLQADGWRVVMFVIPPNPVFVEEQPGGMDQYLSDATTLLEESGADDVIVIDERFSGDLFLDGMHYIEDGREAFTRVLASAVTPPG
jgi:hypothetical protein